MFLTLALAAALQTPPPSSGFDAAGWKLVDPGARVMRYLGRESIYLERGIALLENRAFADGTIEFDVALHGHASFAGVLFRGESPDDYELIYVRPQRSRQPDAIQYTPIFAGQEAWQLYYGPGYTAAAELPLNRWVHVRLVASGYTARVFIDNAAEPQLVVADLKRPWTRGLAGLWGRSGGANFSNVSVTPADTATAPARPNAVPPAGTIASWRISPSADATGVDAVNRPAELRDPASLERVPVEASGVLNIARHRRPASAAPAIVFARAVLRSDRAQRVRLTFGYSDGIAISLNGQLLFTGESGYLSRDASFLGTLTLGLDAVYLDLAAGVNELVVGVTEAFGGWGVAARLDAVSGVAVE